MKDRNKHPKQHKRNIKEILRHKGGTTLIELVVTFVLMGLFAVGTTQVITTSFKVYHQIRELNQARQLSDTLMDKVTGEIEGAQTSVQTEDDVTDGVTLRISDGGSVISLRDRTGSPISIYTSEDGKLIIHYEKINETAQFQYDAVDWKFDDQMYMGFTIQELKFAVAGAEYPENVIQVHMKLGNNGYTFSTTRYVECYNFADEPEKIDGGGVAPEPGDDGSGGESEPDSGGGDGEPETPETPAEGTIYISGDNTISLVKSEREYSDIRREAVAAGGQNIVIPKGIYEENGQYYIFPQDNSANQYNIPSSLAEYYTQWMGKACFKLDGTKLFTQADAVGGQVWVGGRDKAPVMGSIYLYEGKYYVCTQPAEGWAPTDPTANTGNWYDISDFITVTK